MRALRPVRARGVFSSRCVGRPAAECGRWERPFSRALSRAFSSSVVHPPVHWRPSDASSSQLAHFAERAATRHGLSPFTERGLEDYRRLHSWSCREPGAFWSLLWDELGFVGERGTTAVRPADAAWATTGNPMASFFPEASLNHAENLLAHGDPEAPALLFYSERGQRRKL